MRSNVEKVSMRTGCLVKKEMTRKDFQNLFVTTNVYHEYDIENGRITRRIFYVIKEQQNVIIEGLNEYFESGYYSFMVASACYAIWPLEDYGVAYVSFK